MAVADLIAADLAGVPRDPSGTTSLRANTRAHVGDFQLVGQIKDLFYRARDVRRPVVAQWFKNYQVLRNRTWQSGRASWMPAPEVPEIYPIITSLVGWMTDTQPNLDVVPACAPYSEHVQFYSQLAQDLDFVLDATWQLESYDAEIEKVLWDAHMYGTGFFKTTWDDTLHNGMGNAIMRRVDPFTFYPDPNARSMEDANYFIEVRTMSLQDIDRRWPGAAAKLGTSGYTEDAEEAPTATSAHHTRPQMPMANPGAISPNTDSRYGLPGQTDRALVTDDPGVTVLEAWLRTPKHPSDADRRTDTWRCVVVAGNLIVMDEMAEDMWSHGQHPYERYVLHDTGEFWGFSLVEMLTPSQLSINRLLAAIEHNIWLIGNPVFVEDYHGPVRAKIPNRPGARVPVMPNGKAEWLVPPQMHPQLSADLIRFYIEEMERISGLMAMGRGNSPGGRNAQDVLNSVQEAGFVRVRLALRGLERTLRQAGYKVASLITEFYDRPRMVAMIGPSGERTSLALSGKHFYLPDDKGNARIPLRFQLLIEAGSSLPTSRAARASEADALGAMGFLDGEAVLEAHKWPNRWAITQRVREMQAANGTLGQPPGARQRAGRTT